jgi:uncharacterized protein YggU (UPF0235/DUF167 family)
MGSVLRLSVRVKPGASRTRVGGRHGDAALVVTVTEKAVGGAATEAVLRAVAEALGIPRRSVTLLVGATSRDKVLGVEPGERRAELLERVSQLLGPQV